MENRKMIPEIRFSGFTDPWEQRKLGETCQVTMGQSPNGSTYSEIPSKYILVQGNADLKDGWVFPRIWTTQKTRVANVGDIIMTVRAPAGAVGKTSYNVVLGRGVSGVKGNEFIYQSLVKMDIDGYWKKLAAGSTFESINCDDVNEANLMVPKDIDEQNRIGELLSILDNLITLHQRKLEKLKTFKKAMLDKMFPKNGELVPEIRFSGFTDPWEQRKLDDITDVRDGTHDSPQYLEVGHPFVTSKNVKDGFINYEDIQYISDQDFEEINKRSKVDKNDILMGMIGTIGNIALVREVPDFAIKNIALIKDIGDIFYHYLYHCLQSNSVVHQLDENLDGGTQKFIALNKIRELVIPVPSEYEQHKIGECMGLLDNIITLHQRKLEKLQNIKKSMLNKMFI